MTAVTAGLIGIVVLFLLLFSRMYIGIAMALVGLIGFACIRGFENALGLVQIVPYGVFSSYAMIVLPLFILMGQFAFYSGLSKDLYDTVHNWLGRLRGGLAMATVGACAFFAAVSGSSLATAATIGTVALPEMKRYGYDDKLATGAIAAGGTLGIMIPPSVTLVIYGLTVEQSIGKLFLAGFIPGILQAIFYMITIYVLTKRNPALGPPGPATSFKEKIVSLKNTWVVLVLFVLIIGGLYLGVFSPTEAAGVGAFGAFVFALARRRLKWQNFKDSLLETISTTGMVFLIMVGATLLTYFLSVSRLPAELSNTVLGLGVNRYIVLFFILLVYLILGCLMDPISMMLITLPIFYPLIVKAGFDPIWFGIMVTRMAEIGNITPPVGVNVFVIKGIAKDVEMYTIFRGIIPFLISDLFHVALLIVVPEIATFLPSSM